MDYLYLFLSICSGTGRSIFSKKMSSDGVKTSVCFRNQCIMFLAAAVVISIFYIPKLLCLTPATVLWGIAFGIFAFLAQWCFMLALSKGPTSICTMIYSFGFLLPTITGVLFWNEPFGFASVAGIGLAVAAIAASAFSSNKDCRKGKFFIVPNLIAMLSSGMLGVLQKTHQKSADSDNLGPFLVIAFLVSSLVALVFMVCTKPPENKTKQIALFPALTGTFFGISSMLNTFIAGRLPSKIMFPVSNIGVMLFCIVIEVFIFKHTPAKTQIVALILGVLSVVTLTLA